MIGSVLRRAQRDDLADEEIEDGRGRRIREITYGSPTVLVTDEETGEMAGYAWSEKDGWLPGFTEEAFSKAAVLTEAGFAAAFPGVPPLGPLETAPSATTPAASTTGSSRKWRFPPGVEDVTLQALGKPFAIVGAEACRRAARGAEAEGLTTGQGVHVCS